MLLINWMKFRNFFIYLSTLYIHTIKVICMCILFSSNLTITIPCIEIIGAQLFWCYLQSSYDRCLVFYFYQPLKKPCKIISLAGAYKLFILNCFILVRGKKLLFNVFIYLIFTSHHNFCYCNIMNLWKLGYYYIEK